MALYIQFIVEQWPQELNEIGQASHVTVWVLLSPSFIMRGGGEGRGELKLLALLFNLPKLNDLLLYHASK